MIDPDFSKNKSLHHKQLTKSLNTLMGIVNGIVCDGHLHDTEIHFLSTWLHEQEGISTVYPANVIFRRVKEILRDGVIDTEERDHLLNELKILSGNDFSNTGYALPENIAASFDDYPHIIFSGNVFVLTGEFLFGTRNVCNQAILIRGGIFGNSVTLKTNYLVVGSMSSPDWIVANFGKKKQKSSRVSKSWRY